MTVELCPKKTDICSVEFQALYEGNFLSSWLLEDVEGDEKREREDEQRSQRRGELRWEERGGGREG